MINRQNKPLIDLTGRPDPGQQFNGPPPDDFIDLPAISPADLGLLIKGLKAVRYKAKKSLTPGFVPAPGAIDVNLKSIGDCTRLIAQYEALLPQSTG